MSDTIPPPPPSPRFNTPEGVELHLAALVDLVPQLRPLRDKVGAIPPRINPSGFAGIAKVVCGQQLSVQSAAAIWKRFEALPGALTPAGYLALDEETIRTTGFSRSKVLTVRTIAAAVLDGSLDFAAVDALPADEAIRTLVALKGIGPWTAEVYMLFCAAHPDVFPAGDLALLKAVQHGLGLDSRPSIKQMVGLAAAWSPHRSAAALLFWRYFAFLRDREGILL